MPDLLAGKLSWTDGRIEKKGDDQVLEKAANTRRAMKDYAKRAKKILKGKKDVVSLLDDDDTDWDTSPPQDSKEGVYFRREDEETDCEGDGLMHLPEAGAQKHRL